MYHHGHEDASHQKPDFARRRLYFAVDYYLVSDSPKYLHHHHKHFFCLYSKTLSFPCYRSREDAIEVMRNWQRRLDASVRKDMRNLDVDYFACDGFQIYLETSAIVKIPLRVPFIDLQEVSIRSYAGAIGIRAETNNYYGLDIG